MYGTPRVAKPRPLIGHDIMTVVVCTNETLAQAIADRCARSDPTLNIIVGVGKENSVSVGGHMGDLPNAAQALANRLAISSGVAWRVEPWA
ncbi:MAG: hypothetical protein EBS00_02080 [Verrucomicrobia bacterium]|nr:hypothetical protein [Verrucomicrobiota bacterium]